MKFQVLVEVETNNDNVTDDSHTVYEFIVQEVLAGKRKATSNFMRERCKMRVLIDHAKMKPYNFV